MGPIGEQLFGAAPGGTKEFRLPVAFEGGFVVPKAVGEKDVIRLCTTKKLQMLTSGETQYLLFAFPENGQKVISPFLLKSEFYDTFDHEWKSI